MCASTSHFQIMCFCNKETLQKYYGNWIDDDHSTYARTGILKGYLKELIDYELPNRVTKKEIDDFVFSIEV